MGHSNFYKNHKIAIISFIVRFDCDLVRTDLISPHSAKLYASFRLSLSSLRFTSPWTLVLIDQNFTTSILYSIYPSPVGPMPCYTPVDKVILLYM